MFVRTYARMRVSVYLGVYVCVTKQNEGAITRCTKEASCTYVYMCVGEYHACICRYIMHTYVCVCVCYIYLPGVLKAPHSSQLSRAESRPPQPVAAKRRKKGENKFEKKSDTKRIQKNPGILAIKGLYVPVLPGTRAPEHRCRLQDPYTPKQTRPRSLLWNSRGTPKERLSAPCL